MSLVYAGIASHAPGITGRADMVEPAQYARVQAAYARQRQAILDSGAEALMLVSSEHFANFFMDNMPAFAIGMADGYDTPIEDPAWLKTRVTKVPANAGLSLRIIEEVMQTSDLSYAQEWKFDHGIAVPLHFLTPEYDMPVIPVNINCQAPPLPPLHRTWAFGQALRRAIDKVPERIALVSTGGTSHWPCTPDSGRINHDWDLEFLDRVLNTRKRELLSYVDGDTYALAGQGAFEMRTSICVAAACEGAKGELWLAEPIPIFATSIVVGTLMQVPRA